MKELMNFAGNVLEEVKEAEAICESANEEIHTFTKECGSFGTIACC